MKVDSSLVELVKDTPFLSDFNMGHQLFNKYILNTILIHCMQSISRGKWELDNNKGQVAKS